jgi:hypothetical protein
MIGPGSKSLRAGPLLTIGLCSVSLSLRDADCMSRGIRMRLERLERCAPTGDMPVWCDLSEDVPKTIDASGGSATGVRVTHKKPETLI